MLRGLWQNVRHARVISGASTIPMQVARMEAGWSRSLVHKIQEMVSAVWLVHRFGHEALLRQYLTIAPYGNRVHGAVRASKLYFDKPAEDFSWLQAAFLAGLPQMPGRMNPYTEDGKARGLRRAHRILRQLHARGILTGDELHEALESDVGLVPLPKRSPSAMHAVLAWSAIAPARPVVTATLDLRRSRRRPPPRSRQP